MPEPPATPTKPKTRNAEALAKKPPAFRQRRQVKGDAALILLPTAKPPAVKQSTAKATSASAQEITAMFVNAGSLKHHAGASKDHQ